MPAVAQGWVKPALPQAESQVAGGPAGKAKPRKLMKGPRTPDKVPAAGWPKASAVAVTLRQGTTRVEGLPLSLDTRVKRPADAATGAYTVSTLSRVAARKTGSDGPVFALTPHLGSASRGGAVRAAVDYSSFAGLYGGGYADRLTLVRLPACALTMPQKAQCRTAQPVETVNDTEKQTLTAKSLTLSASSATVLAATASSGSDRGDYKATSLSASSTWNTDQSTGSFAWAYDMAVPQVP
ncbi:sugar-binding protein, partial [Streptomyces sp. ME18-1-4]|nr:sugar-binding protein [Streptomyces sp. ME18-1-4]